MELAERALPVRMRRVAVVALADRTRDVLVAMAHLGVIDLSGPIGSGEGPALEALRRLESNHRIGSTITPALARQIPDVADLERRDARELLAGEVELDRRRASAVAHGDFLVFVGWAPQPALTELRESLQGLGAALVELRAPWGRQPPTLLAPAPAAEPFRPLLTTYGAVPYEDVDPTPFVAVTYCLMFGMMFGDVGDGALIVLAALALEPQSQSPAGGTAQGVADDRGGGCVRGSVWVPLRRNVRSDEAAADAVARAARFAHATARGGDRRRRRPAGRRLCDRDRQPLPGGRRGARADRRTRAYPVSPCWWAGSWRCSGSPPTSPG